MVYGSVALESWRGRQEHLTIQGFPGLAVLVGRPCCISLARKAVPPGECLAVSDSDPGRPAGHEWGVTAETVCNLCQQGQLTDAVEALDVLAHTEICVSQSLFYAVLKACVVKKDLVLGRRVHALTVKTGYESDTFLCNHILRMYSSHGRLQEAMDVFTKVVKPDAFMWSSIISAHVRQGEPKQAVELYHQMVRSGVKPDCHVFVAALQACAKGADLESGQQVHADVLTSKIEPDLFVCNSLVDMYAKCGSMKEARKLFDGLRHKDVVTWNALITGYAQQGMSHDALDLYSAMSKEGNTPPNSVTFVCLLQACASLGTSALEKGKQLHAQIEAQGREVNVIVGNNLINMYTKCGSLQDAWSVFQSLRQKDLVTWTALIAGYSRQGMGREALHLYSAMQQQGIAAPDAVTFVCLLQACASVGVFALEAGKQLHAQIREVGLEADVTVCNNLINMYAKCGSLHHAQNVFDGLSEKDVVSWTALIAGYSQEGMNQEALHLYSAMQEEGVAAPNSVTFICLLQACAIVGPPALESGKQLHAQIRERALHGDDVMASSLVKMYARCGSLQDAQNVFDGIQERDVTVWNAMIAGYSQQGMDQEALCLFRAMEQQGVTAPNAVTFTCLLQACASVAALHDGRQLHAHIKELGLEANVVVATSLMNMYSKSGSMGDAQQVFDSLPERDEVAWNALIAGYARQGDCDVVLNLVQGMTQEGWHPNAVTFLSVLAVCSHAGLVSKGQEYFKAMTRDYGITPTAEHYSCMVDLLGRAGQLDDALVLVRAMPVQPHEAVWHALLGACQKWSNVVVGRYAFDEAVKLDEKDPSAYVSMLNIYTDAHMWEEAEEMQLRRTSIGAWKQPGQSWWTDMDGVVHTFLVGDTKHIKSEEMYGRLQELLPKMKTEGYHRHVWSSCE